ncbi:MAG: translation initiation factor [Verrucomicrobia bacterium]|nr:translation initiation factor [Verrucomicrobiota bacterium]MDA1066431.1 translation initiation factor [Verrucomicrobiota bacterium]
MGKKKERLSVSGEDTFENNPFAALSIEGLKSLPASSPVISNSSSIEKKKSRGRLDVKREKSGRGGKTVTVVYGMQHIELREREHILKQLKTSCGVGGALKGPTMEVQGDNRENVQRILEEAGFKVVLAGG